MNIVKYKNTIYLTLIAAVSALFKIGLALKWKGMLFDDMVSVYIARQSLSNIWTYLQWEMHPPLHYLYLHFWINVFGDSDVIMRISTIFISIISIFIIYLLTKKISQNSQAAVLAAFFTAFSSYQIYFSTWIRMYALLFFLASLSFLIFLYAVEKNKKSLWILLTIVQTLAVYTHLTAIFIFIIEAIYILFLKYKKTIKINTIYKWFLSGFVSFLLFLPWLYNFISVRLKIFPSNSWYFWAEGYDSYFLTIPVKFQFAGVENNILDLLGTIIVIIGIIFFIFDFKITDKKITSTVYDLKNIILPLSILFIPLLIFFIFKINTLRFMFISSIGLYIIIGIGLFRIIQKTKIPSFYIYSFFVSIIILVFVSLYSTDYTIGWKKIINFINQNSTRNELILASHPFQLLPFYTLYTGKLPYISYIQEDIKTNNLVVDILKTNFYPVFTEDNVNKIDDLTKDYDRIFLIRTDKFFTYSNRLVFEYLILKGWKPKKNLKIKTFTEPEVWILEK